MPNPYHSSHDSRITIHRNHHSDQVSPIVAIIIALLFIIGGIAWGYYYKIRTDNIQPTEVDNAAVITSPTGNSTTDTRD